MEVEAQRDAGTAATSRTLPLIGRADISLSEALDDENDMLARLSYPEKRLDFFVSLHLLRHTFAALVHRDLGLDSDETCELSEPREWIHGSFNVCIPVDVHNWKKNPGRRVLLRLPLPYKTGDLQFPGNTDEKIRTEAATYLWLQDVSADVSIPKLWSFGFASGQSFVLYENAPLLARTRWWVRRLLSLFTRQAYQHSYVSALRPELADHSYLLMDCLDSKDGRMLSETWRTGYEDPRRRKNLFHGLARTMLSLSDVPLPRIGSWTIDDHGVLSLSNRPLLDHIESLENEGVKTEMPRTRTYNNTDSYYFDLLSCHDKRILQKPNSILDEEDGLAQMACLFAMRGLIHNLVNPELRHGPFAFTLTDLHASNIFVDDEWNVKHVIDLEWGCSLPLEMHSPPFWLTDRGIDEMYQKDELDKYDKIRQEFMAAFETEEQQRCSRYSQPSFRSRVMTRTWQTGFFWYQSALLSPTGCYNLFRRNMLPMFLPDIEMKDLARYIAPFWAKNARDVIKSKLADKEVYEARLKALFTNTSATDE